MRVIRIGDRQPVQAEGYTKHILLDGDDMRCAGSRVQIVTIQPGDSVADHVHQRTHEFYLVLQGRCLLTVNSETSMLRPGDMLLMEPGDIHSLANKGTIPFEVLVFKTNADNDTHWLS